MVATRLRGLLTWNTISALEKANTLGRFTRVSIVGVGKQAPSAVLVISKDQPARRNHALPAAT